MSDAFSTTRGRTGIGALMLVIGLLVQTSRAFGQG